MFHVKEDRSTVVFAGEKLFHAWMHILIVTLAGVFATAITIDLPIFLFLISPEQIFLIIVRIVLVVIGFYYLLNTYYDAQIGLEDLYEVLSERKAERLQVINQENKKKPVPLTEEVKQNIEKTEELIPVSLDETVSKN